MAISTPLGTPYPLFDFAPQPEQDAELLKQIGFIPGAKEILTLRQVHALEHATVWVLSEIQKTQHLMDSHINPAELSGLSTDQGFYLYGNVQTAMLYRAVRVALRRLVDGDWHLAVHPRCGTNISVNVALTVGLAMGMHFLMPRGPIEQLLGLGIATSAAAQISPDLGSMVQQYLTTAIPFNLTLDSIHTLPKEDGMARHFVKVHWI